MSDYERDGLLLLPALVDAPTLAQLREEADRLLGTSTDRGGARNVLGKSALFRELASSGAPSALAHAALGPTARPTKLTLFDKTPRANWKVPWHQDLTVTVRERRDALGWGPWSVKDGLPHVQPPAELLAQTLAIRLHLDDTPADNGALHVLPGSHREGRLSDAQIARLRHEVAPVVCEVAAGGAMLMSPLLLHASRPAVAPSRRRVLHFEYCAASLPAGLERA